MGETSRAVISGSRPFNTVFGLPRDGENIAKSSGTFQSGSPPGLATKVVEAALALTARLSEFDT
jgi:hypothetical protein